MKTVKRVTVTAPRLGEAAAVERGWFLWDCRWQDPVWTFAPTNVLEERAPVCIRWDFALSGEHRLTDRPYAALLESAKCFIALTRSRSLGSGLAQRARTVDGYFLNLRELLRWMSRESLRRFADLDAAALAQFQRAISSRPGIRGSKLSPLTTEHYLHMLIYLYRFRGELPDALQVDPCPGQRIGHLLGVRRVHARGWPHTPEAIAVPLIHGAIEFLERCAIDILRARELYAASIARTQQLGYHRNACDTIAGRALRAITLTGPRGTQRIRRS
jgi:hypothetical protein